MLNYCFVFLKLIDEEDGPRLTFAVQNHFKALAMREGRTRRSSVHHQSLVTMSRRYDQGPFLQIKCLKTGIVRILDIQNIRISEMFDCLQLCI